MEPSNLGANIHFCTKYGLAIIYIIHQSSLRLCLSWWCLLERMCQSKAEIFTRNDRVKVTINNFSYNFFYNFFISKHFFITFPLFGHSSLIFFPFNIRYSNDLFPVSSVYILILYLSLFLY